jgi:hypothetical protein
MIEVPILEAQSQRIRDSVLLVPTVFIPTKSEVANSGFVGRWFELEPRERGRPLRLPLGTAGEGAIGSAARGRGPRRAAPARVLLQLPPIRAVRPDMTRFGLPRGRSALSSTIESLNNKKCDFLLASLRSCRATSGAQWPATLLEIAANAGANDRLLLERTARPVAVGIRAGETGLLCQ